MASRKNTKQVVVSKALKKRSLKSALLGADWFVNTQVNDVSQPTNDANKGRFLYNAHCFSSYGTWGIDWTSARAVFILLAAYRETKKKVYLDTVKNGLKYIYSLQVMDKRDKSLYGVFHEETPQSFWVFPRDGIELADCLLEYYRITKDKEALFRAELFLDWFIRETMFKTKKGITWVYRQVDFDGKKDPAIACCEGGNTMALAHAYKITGKAKYKIAMKKIMDSQIEMYHQAEGPFIDKYRGEGHHVAKGGAIDNDDGAGIGLLCAYDILKDKKYLTHALSLADYHVSKNAEYSVYCALPAACTFLMEITKYTKDDKYLKMAVKQINKIFTYQHFNPKSLNSHGAFIGEDEGGINYVAGFKPKPEEMVTTRTTAFACLSLFKLASKHWPLGYSVI
ncbi:MAG: hypothetical protein COA79_11760 [Planctomycetota bacterium]|nr:MAG: hypothetical protein COA79_11760 [Planctomycetota bacterium]